MRLYAGGIPGPRLTRLMAAGARAVWPEIARDLTRRAYLATLGAIEASDSPATSACRVLPSAFVDGTALDPRNGYPCNTGPRGPNPYGDARPFL